MDRGNWSVDLQAGSEYGYKLLFVILLSGLGAIVLQVIVFIHVTFNFIPPIGSSL